MKGEGKGGGKHGGKEPRQLWGEESRAEEMRRRGQQQAPDPSPAPSAAASSDHEKLEKLEKLLEGMKAHYTDDPAPYSHIVVEIGKLKETINASKPSFTQLQVAEDKCSATRSKIASMEAEKAQKWREHADIADALNYARDELVGLEAEVDQVKAAIGSSAITMQQQLQAERVAMAEAVQKAESAKEAAVALGRAETLIASLQAAQGTGQGQQCWDDVIKALGDTKKHLSTVNPTAAGPTAEPPQAPTAAAPIVATSSGLGAAAAAAVTAMPVDAVVEAPTT